MENWIHPRKQSHITVTDQFCGAGGNGMADRAMC